MTSCGFLAGFGSREERRGDTSATSFADRYLNTALCLLTGGAVGLPTKIASVWVSGSLTKFRTPEKDAAAAGRQKISGTIDVFQLYGSTG